MTRADATTGNLGDLAITTTQLLDTTGAFNGLQPAAEQAALAPPDIPFGDLLLASVAFPTTDRAGVPLAVGQTGVYTIPDGTKWRVSTSARPHSTTVSRAAGWRATRY